MMDDPIFDLETIRDDGVPVVIVRGDLDDTGASRLDTTVRALQTDGPTSVVVDLVATGILESGGVDMLIRLHSRLHATGAELVLQGPSRTVMAVLHVTGTARLFTIRRS